MNKYIGANRLEQILKLIKKLIDGKANASHNHTKSDITDFPTSLPASDVSAWAKATTKPSYTASEVGLGNVGNFKAVSTVASQELSSTEKSNARANIGAGTSSFSGSYNDLSNKPTIPSGAAASKAVDSSISAASTSTNLPTSAAVASFVEGKGYTKNTGTITEVATSSPLSGSGTSGKVTISHANSGATAGSYGDSAAQTPAYGGTFKVPYVTVNATGHVTGISEHTVKIPASDTPGVATTSANGLMSSTDKSKLNSMAIPSIVYATCATAAATQVKVVTITDTNYTLKNNDVLAVWFTNTNSFNSTTSGYVQLKVGNNTYEIYSNMAKGRVTGTNTTYYGSANCYIFYKIDVTNKCAYWLGHSWDNNSTYTPQSLGIGYGTCATAEATVAKVVTMSGYSLVTNGLVAIKFTYKVPASATLNINSKGAKAIYRNGAAITAGKINAGDTALFVYNGTQYELIATSSYGTQDTNTTYGVATQSANGLMSAADKKALDEMRSVLTGTLAAGETAITFTSSIITNDVFIEPWQYIEGSEEAPIAPTKYSVGTGSVTLYYDAQDKDIRIAIKVGRFT